VGLDVLEEGNGALELPAVDGLGGLAGVLEGDSEVGTAGAGRLGGLNLSGGVSDLVGRTRTKVSRLLLDQVFVAQVFSGMIHALLRH
jgi:hypothetical protein